MKKTYIQPSLEVVQLEVSQSILTGSGVDITEVTLGEGSADNDDAYAPGMGTLLGIPGL